MPNKVSTGKKWLFLIAGIFFSILSSSVAGQVGFKEPFSQKSDSSKLNNYIQSALKLAGKPKYVEQLKAYIDSAEAVCVDKNIDFPILLNLARAEYFYLIGEYKNSSQEGTFALNKAESTDDLPALIKTLDFFGRYSLRTGFFSESVDYFNKSIEIAERNKIKGVIPRSYNNLKDVYSETALNNLKEYRNTLYKMIDASHKENDTASLKMGFWRLGTSFSDTIKDPNHRLADSLLRKCLELSLMQKDTFFTVLSLSNLGWNYYGQKNYDFAIRYYNRALTYSVPSKNHGNSANNFGNLGTIYRDMKDYRNAQVNYKRALEEATYINDIFSLWWVNRDMSDMYLAMGDTSKAFNCYVLYQKYYHEWEGVTLSQGLDDARIRYEAETHRKELELLSLRLRNHKLLIFGSSGLLILSLVIGILLLSRAKIMAKRRISEMNRKISEVTQANLRQQMNPHFIFNTLNSIQYYMYQHDKLATNNYLTKFSSLMRKVLENSQHTSVPLRDELDALNLYLELESIRFKNKFDYQITVDEEIDTLLYKVPTMLIQPYVENSICHGLVPAENKGSVKIELKLENDYIACIIEDNGIGRDAAQARKINKDSKHNSLGTQIVTSRLDLVNTLYGTSLKTIYTDLKNQNGEPEGTRVEIHIPILS
jgi:tetratricopeptide (TPR) repeat protein